jgi:hypothetical protein
MSADLAVLLKPKLLATPLRSEAFSGALVVIHPAARS